MKRRNLPHRVSMETRLNGIVHQEMMKKSPRASVYKKKKGEIPRHQKYKNFDD